jgi:hypothetical protein
MRAIGDLEANALQKDWNDYRATMGGGDKLI